MTKMTSLRWQIKRYYTLQSLFCRTYGSVGDLHCDGHCSLTKTSKDNVVSGAVWQDIDAEHGVMRGDEAVGCWRLTGDTTLPLPPLPPRGLLPRTKGRSQTRKHRASDHVARPQLLSASWEARRAYIAADEAAGLAAGVCCLSASSRWRSLVSSCDVITPISFWMQLLDCSTAEAELLLMRSDIHTRLPPQATTINTRLAGWSVIRYFWLIGVLAAVWHYSFHVWDFFANS